MVTDDEKVPRPPLRLGWLSTGRGPGSRGLLAAAQDAISGGSLNAAIDYVLCTRARGEAEGSDEFLALAEGYGLTTVSLPLREYRQRRDEDPQWRERYNADLLAIVQERNPSMCWCLQDSCSSSARTSSTPRPPSTSTPPCPVAPWARGRT